MKKYIFLLFVLFPVFGFCQYTPQSSQLIKTLEFINPGYNSSKDLASVILLHRNQWTGFEGAPKSYALNVNVPVNKWHTGFGTNIVVETRGLISQTNADLTACVDVKVSSASYMSFGLAAGLESKRIDMGRALSYGNLPYTAEMYNSDNIHAGIGLNYFTHEIHLGGSFHYSQLKGNYYNDNDYYSIYLNGSYLFDLNKDWALKPSAMFRYFGGEADLDYGIFVLYKDIVWAGITNRLGKAMIFFADFKVTDLLRVGYSFDFPVSSNTINYGSHEIRVEINIPRKSKTFERLANR
jgi:type IX secretion system PorP/SprF family membrane protein